MTPDTATAMPFDAVVLAGSRSDDPLATAHGVPSKALIDIGGETMLTRVLRALAESQLIREACIVGDSHLEQTLRTERLLLRWRRIDPADGPSASTALGLRRMRWPVLVTTADHALLTGPIVEEFLLGATATGADLAIGFADQRAVQQRFPETARTPLRFAGTPLCGCNLFAFMAPNAARAPAWWQQVERQRKRPWRLMRMLGSGHLLSYLRGRLSLEAAMARLGELAQCRIAAVLIENPDAAFDVDSERDLEVCRRNLARTK